jgi:hypothetical protein
MTAVCAFRPAGFDVKSSLRSRRWKSQFGGNHPPEAKTSASMFVLPGSIRVRYEISGNQPLSLDAQRDVGNERGCELSFAGSYLPDALLRRVDLLRDNRVRVQQSSELGSRHAPCRHAFGLAGHQSRSVALGRRSPAVRTSTAFPAGREASVGASVAARNQTRRLSPF